MKENQIEIDVLGMSNGLLNALKKEISKNSYHLQNGIIGIYFQNVVMIRFLIKGIFYSLIKINFNKILKYFNFMNFFYSMIPLSESIGISTIGDHNAVNTSHGLPRNLSFAKVLCCY